jgi:hypothetical protein
MIRRTFIQLSTKKYLSIRISVVTRKLIIAIVFSIATGSAALAQGPNSETIYDPNAPDLSAQVDSPLINPLRNDGRREQLRLNQPWNQILESSFFSHDEDY